VRRKGFLGVAGLTVMAGALVGGYLMNSAGGTAEGEARTFGFGRPATPGEIRALDIDVMPDGTGLPAGSGSVAQGAVVYATKCAACHGATGTEGPYDLLVASSPPDSVFAGRRRAVGNYWGFATTLYDYVHRAMPQPAPGTLTADEVYSLVAWILWRNQLIDETAIMDASTLPLVEMPARVYYDPDSRPANLIP
jgi:cytochrome c